MCYIYLNLAEPIFLKKQIQNIDVFIDDFEKVCIDWELIWRSLITTVKHLRSIQLTAEKKILHKDSNISVHKCAAYTKILG